VTLIIDVCQGDLSRSEFVQPIASIVGPGVRVKPYTDVGSEEVDGSDAVIICGTAMADDGYLDNLHMFEWLIKTQTPVLGICAGMQVIALLHGAQVVVRKEIGMTKVEVEPGNPLIPKPTEVYSLHKYDLQDLEEFDVLARSDQCVQAIAHREKPLYGILFHPEVRRGEIIRRFLDLSKALPEHQ
jgi:GMP synthase (glutamine-hydrolysing)